MMIRGFEARVILGSSCPGQGNHPGIILPRQLAGAITLASSWHFESGSAEKSEILQICVFSFWPNPIILVYRMIILIFSNRPVSWKQIWSSCCVCQTSVKVIKPVEHRLKA